MATDIVLELLLVFGTVENQPISRWISNAVAEDEVKTKCHLVDEIVHIAVKTSVVVAGKEEPLLVIQKYPPGKVNCTDPCETASVEDMPGGVIDRPKKE